MKGRGARTLLLLGVGWLAVRSGAAAAETCAAVAIVGGSSWSCALLLVRKHLA